MSIAENGKVVLIHFKLKDAESGELLEDTSDRAPMPYLHGHHNIMPGLEAVIAGKSMGDTFSVTLAPEQAYGPHNGEEPTPYPRSMFPPDAQIFEGMSFLVTDNNGNEGPVFVTKVEGDLIHLDANHPLAGRSLTFEGRIESVREPTGEELAHGHPHGPDGTHHH
ncbi:MAG: peptidylprolyl isomerase [Myxococcota bacterium]|nr:peptidylprolyl isomerase [Myxococcota bacterium]